MSSLIKAFRATSLVCTHIVFFLFLEITQYVRPWFDQGSLEQWLITGLGRGKYKLSPRQPAEPDVKTDVPERPRWSQ